MFVASSVLLAFVSLVVAQGVYITDPSLTQCSDASISFTPTTGPYYVAILPANDPCSSDSIAEFYNVNDPSVDYYVALPQGSNVVVYVIDANGNESYSDSVQVGDGDSSCLGTTSSDTSDYSPPADTGDYTPADTGDYTPADTSDAAPADTGDVAPVDPGTSDDNSDPAPAVVTTSSGTTVTTTNAPDADPTTTPLSMTYSVDNSSNDDSSSDSDPTVNNPVNAANDVEGGAASVTIGLTTLGLGAFTAFLALL